MIEALNYLYSTLQMLKNPSHKERRARWYVRKASIDEWAGPFEAVEVAYQLLTAALGPRDEVVDGRTQRRFRVENHPFLMKWTKRSDERERQLLRGLKKAVWERARRQRVSLPSRKRWPPDVLDAEERRAFEVLALDPDSSIEAIRRRHRELAKANHPDRGGSLRRMKEINWAYDVASKVLPTAS